MSADATQPAGVEVEAAGEHRLLLPSPADRQLLLSDLLRRSNLPLNTRCGGRGACDGCQIELVRGTLLKSTSREPIVANDEPVVVRACQCRLDSTSVKIRIPLRSSMRHEPQVVADYQIRVPFAHDPLYPIRDSIGNAPSGSSSNLGVAVDIGTTTVALLLVDLADGAVLARSSKFNEQVHLGEDVVTRINLCAMNREMIGQFQQAVANRTILPLLETALQRSARSIESVRCLSIAGNTTMLHLLAGVDPTSMGTAPFTPQFLEHRIYPSGAIFGKSALGEDVPCHLLPGAAAYVGADLTAGVVASGLYYDPGPSLLIDVGTNGEIILKNGDDLIGCATAAGPAFEGALLSSGMRAVTGAISHVTIDSQGSSVECETIGNDHMPPIGICGSAYVDFLANAHTAGLLTDTGRFNLEVNGELRERMIPWTGNDTAFRLAHGRGKQPIVISAHDIASLLQAKAAIAAGILTLLAQFNLQPRDIRTVYLAGGFGTKMDRAAAIACGLLPQFTVEQVIAVGNTSLAGAYLFLMDSGMVSEICTAAANIRSIELNLDPGFESCFIDQLCIPALDSR
jgi:uncharacterized 2Fe-2S/4Fe-4S cluster protein (DUF4445 family)